MSIEEYIKLIDVDTYNKIIKMYKISKSPKEIELGDKVENLMKHDSYKRVRGKLVQRGWG